MSDLTDLRMTRLAAVLEGASERKAAPKGGGKVKPRPPWLDDEDDSEPDDDDTSPDDTDEDEDDEDDENDSRPNRRGRGAPTGKRRGAVPAKKSRRRGEVKADRITVWGPPAQSVDITRARVPDRASDARVDREARRSHSEDGIAPPPTGRAGGNGVTRGRSGARAAAPVPGNLRRRRRSDDGPAPKGEMGEGSAQGRSGSAIIMRRPGNLKSLWDYEPAEVQSALEVAEKVLGSLRSDFGRAGE